MDSKLNLLFVSIAFPPKSDPECLQTAKYFKYLSKDETLNIDVVTSQDKTLFMPIDKDLVKYAKGYRQIIKVPFFENKYVNFLMRKIDKEILQYPDSKFRFAKKWRYVIDRLENKPDIMYSRSSPISSAIMSYELQKKLQIPWVMHLSDPWTIDPDHFYSKSKEWNETMEQKCFDSASALSFTSEKTIELYQKKYPQYSNKMILFPNVFDFEDKKETKHQFGDKIRVVFTGGLVGNRSADSLLRAIEEMAKNNEDIVNDFEFLFAGALDKKNKMNFVNTHPSVYHMGILSYSEALNLQATADILLLIDTPFQNENDALFFPSKLLDYMLMQKRILALTSKNGTSWKFIDAKIGDCIEHADRNLIVEKLLEYWSRWKQKDRNYFIHNNIDKKYSADFNANKLSILFHKLNKKGK